MTTTTAPALRHFIARGTWTAATLAALAGLGSLTASGCRGREPTRSEAPPAQPAPAPSSPAPTPPSGPDRTTARGPQTPRAEVPDAALALSRAFATVAAALQPSVVRIDVSSRAPERRFAQHQAPLDDILRRFFELGPGQGEPDGQPAPAQSTGSGVILDSSGNVITNRHVVAGGGDLRVTLQDGRELGATLVGADAWTDVAVIRIKNPPKDLVVARLGNSDELQVGEWVLACGSPLGMAQTVTAGIVSGKGRVGGRIQMSGARVRQYIQTDAKINPGNSGGPLTNLKAEVVGINTLINVGPGGSYGFAIPINQVNSVASMLIKEGRARYPYLGVMVGSIADLEPGLRQQAGTDKGAFITQVTPGGPAEKAGLRPGDVIIALDDQKVELGGDVIDYVASRAIGSKVRVKVLRGGKTQSFDVTLGELDSPDRPRDGKGRIGAALQTLDEDLARSLGLPPNARGVVVTQVVPGSAAERAGLRPGDVILDIDRRPVASADQAVSALRAPSPNGHLLRVLGPDGMRFVSIRPE